MRSPSRPAGNLPNSVRGVALMGVLGALLILVQVGLAVLPNIELVSLLIILYTLIFGKRAFIPVFIFILAEGLLYGFGLWWLNYLYVWPILAAVALLFQKQRSPVFWAIVSAAYGLCFGALCAIPYLFIGGPPSAFAYWVQGIPFDVLHCVGNGIAALLLFKPLLKLFERLGARLLAAE
ncbi:MAG TPA: hypothetical protein VN366_07535 [Feifaniaceae bacterium]|nr:hypothetical protein [Feifaniaceae bacterium]